MTYAWSTSPKHDERMERFAAAGLYMVTSASASGGRSTPELVRAALSAGVRLVQLREKALSTCALFALAQRVRRCTREADALLIINDRLDVALAAEADGVHLGQDDLPIAAARRLAPDLIIGASTHSVAEAVQAERDGASYVNIGPLFPTGTKPHATAHLGLTGLSEIAAVVRIPFTVMGGIKASHIPELRRAGVRTVAVVTAVTAAPDPHAAAATLLLLIGDA